MNLAEHDALLTAREVALRLRLCTATVYKLCERGELPHVRVGNSIRVRPAVLAAYLSRRSAGNTGGIPPPPHHGGTS